MDYCGVELACLGNESTSFCWFWDCTQVLHFELFVHYEHYSISFKGFLPTVVDIMVIWIKFAHSCPFQFTDSLRRPCSLLLSLFDHVQFTLIPGPNITGSYAIQGLYSIRLYFHHNWVLFPLWLSHFILSGAISNCPLLFPSRTLDTFWSGWLIFQGHIFLPFHTVHGILQERILQWLLFPPSADHILSELFTITHLS